MKKLLLLFSFFSFLSESLNSATPTTNQTHRINVEWIDTSGHRQVVTTSVGLPPGINLSTVKVFLGPNQTDSLGTSSKEVIQTTPTPPPVHPNPEIESRRQFVISMAKESWTAFANRYISDQLITKNSTTISPAHSRTIVGSLSTLWLMGLQEEFQLARDWVQSELDVNQSLPVGLLELPGGLLSAFALTGDKIFLDKAREVADVYDLDPVVKDSNENKVIQNWIAKRLEYRFLTAVSGEPKYWAQLKSIEKILKRVKEVEKIKDSNSGHLYVHVKSFLQSNGTEDNSEMKRYYRVIDAMIRHEYISSFQNLAQIRSEPYKTMNIRHCFYGAMLALGAQALPLVRHSSSQKKKTGLHWDLAQKITETCHLASNSTKTGLPYREFSVKDGSTVVGSGGYSLESQIAESYFIFYRLTGDAKYRNYAWELAQAIHSHSRAPDGYGQVRDANQSPTEIVPIQTPEFLAQTLKYLYLIFANDNFVPLSQWVFTTTGQVLPVCGQNQAVPVVEKCPM